MTLKDRLKQRIRADGPMPVSEFMEACLFDPGHGYYNRPDAIGAKGAFTTAPEISQMFGEIIGVFFAKCWIDQGRPNPFAMAELGPGRGTLMADIMRAAGNTGGFGDAAQIVLVERSRRLRSQQRATLSRHNPVWADDVFSIPGLPLMLVANEFFDALPIRQFRRHRAGWKEIEVAVGLTGLEFHEAESAERRDMHIRFNHSEIGDIVELRSAADPIVSQISKHVGRFGGAALVIDYGGVQSRGNTLQAVKDHKFAHPLDDPGEADISAHVDFGALRGKAAGISVTELLPQGVWLERMGLTERAQTLAKSLQGDELRQHIEAHRRLAHPEMMSNLFKVMALHPQATPAPPGFAQ